MLPLFEPKYLPKKKKERVSLFFVRHKKNPGLKPLEIVG